MQFLILLCRSAKPPLRTPPEAPVTASSFDLCGRDLTPCDVVFSRHPPSRAARIRCAQSRMSLLGDGKSTVEQCTKRRAASMAPFYLLMLGNLRTFPNALNGIHQLACDYQNRDFLTVVATAERVQHSDRAWWMTEVTPETMITPALTQLQALNQSHPGVLTSFCHPFEVTVISKDRLEGALPPRLIRDIDVKRDNRGHCAYNEKLGRLKMEYIKIALERAEKHSMEQFARPMGKSDLVIVTRPDVSLGQRSQVLRGLEEMADILQREPEAVFLNSNTWGLHDQWWITSYHMLKSMTDLDLSCAFYGIREFDRYCITSEQYLLYMFNLLCAKLYYVDEILSQLSMMRGDDLSFVAPDKFLTVERCPTSYSNERSKFPDIISKVPFEGVFPGSKGGGMFMNETFRSRNCQDPAFCSSKALASGRDVTSQQEPENILP